MVEVRSGSSVSVVVVERRDFEVLLLILERNANVLVDAETSRLPDVTELAASVTVYVVTLDSVENWVVVKGKDVVAVGVVEILIGNVEVMLSVVAILLDAYELSEVSLEAVEVVVATLGADVPDVESPLGMLAFKPLPSAASVPIVVEKAGSKFDADVDVVSDIGTVVVVIVEKSLDVVDLADESLDDRALVDEVPVAEPVSVGSSAVMALIAEVMVGAISLTEDRLETALDVVKNPFTDASVSELLPV